MTRKQRIEITDSLGRKRSLDQGGTAFVRVDLDGADLGGANFEGPEDAPLLLLGLGPEPGKALQRFTPKAWVEAPDFLQALAHSRGVSQRELIPAAARGWRLDPDQALSFFSTHKPKVILYRQGPQLFPDFWGPLLAKLRLRAHSGFRQSGQQDTVLLTGSDRDLLHLDLKFALDQLGFQVLEADAGTRPERLHELVLKQRPRFCLSVNLHGLDPDGDLFFLLRELDIPLAIWFVDNPWLILSRLRLDWWKQAALFVTGSGFVEDLRRHGAKQVWHLPLAASPFFRQPRSEPLLPGVQLVFAGRASFPDKDKYFGASHLPLQILEQARQLGLRADFNWWRDQLGATTLWPGQQARQAGLGAETIGRELRIAWLSAPASTGLRIYGNGEWPRLLPQDSDIQPPVDYYRQLPGIYKAAPFCLGLTSPLLPGALSQRFFDVWQAGGFLLCPPEPGLDLFPPDLVAMSIVQDPAHLPEKMAQIQASPQTKQNVIYEWQKIIEHAHSYRCRLEFVLEKLGH